MRLHHVSFLHMQIADLRRPCVIFRCSHGLPVTKCYTNILANQYMLKSYFVTFFTSLYVHAAVVSCVSTEVPCRNWYWQLDNNALWSRYLRLRQDTSVFELVQILLNVVFPEQESDYIVAVAQQTRKLIAGRDTIYQISWLIVLSVYKLHALQTYLAPKRFHLLM